jgi:hypothetical protein
VEPSGAWKQARANSFLVAFPDNWQAYGGAASDSLMVAPAGGATKTANGAIDLGIGVMLSYYQPERKGMPLGTATLSLVAYLSSHDPSIQLASPEQRNVTVDGSPGRVSVLRATSLSLGPETNILLTVTRPEGIFYALAIAPVRAFPPLERTFNQIMSSIRFGQGVSNPLPDAAPPVSTH